MGVSARRLALVHPVQNSGLKMEKIPPGNLLLWYFQFSGQAAARRRSAHGGSHEIHFVNSWCTEKILVSQLH